MKFETTPKTDKKVSLEKASDAAIRLKYPEVTKATKAAALTELKASRQVEIDQKLAEVRKLLATEQPTGQPTSPEQAEKKLIVMKLSELQALAKEQGKQIYYHGGLPIGADMDTIDLNRLGTQQNKKNRTWGGFYLADESPKSLEWATKYAKEEERSGMLHGFIIDDDSRILDLSDRESTDRLSKEERDEYAKQYDFIRGKSVQGYNQYSLLNKKIITAMGGENLKQEKE